ncbi:non-homologous end-joining DNA ligase [Fodinicola feengrottensis]|uniref:non-homologous end-joining DNA ligase n=1 Tax=Fodinicola feengrottensis TaxID=435914 RepID=UPI0013CF5896|nr:non-homologous end-joining DNA ligase [Fodinicola feengrottensis]
MLASPGDLPVGPEWAYEVKWDGIRAIASAAGGRLRLHSRSDKDVTAIYPELAGLAEMFPEGTLDGEIVAFDKGRPSFPALQDRMNVDDPRRVARLVELTPVTLVIFDLLRLDRLDLTPLPYADRRETLEQLDLNGPRWITAPAFDDGAATLAASRELGLEGVLAKRLRSPYVPAARSRDWIKVKSLRTQECVVGGWASGEKTRTGQIGSLLLGIPENGQLRYVGRVGSGVAGATLDKLTALLTPLVTDASPFHESPPRRDARTLVWCAPEVVVEVAYANWTTSGVLWHPRLRGIRYDKTPSEVSVE